MRPRLPLAAQLAARRERPRCSSPGRACRSPCACGARRSRRSRRRSPRTARRAAAVALARPSRSSPTTAPGPPRPALLELTRPVVVDGRRGLTGPTRPSSRSACPSRPTTTPSRRRSRPSSGSARAAAASTPSSRCATRAWCSATPRPARPATTSRSRWSPPTTSGCASTWTPRPTGRSRPGSCARTARDCPTTASRAPGAPPRAATPSSCGCRGRSSGRASRSRSWTSTTRSRGRSPRASRRAGPRRGTRPSAVVAPPPATAALLDGLAGPADPAVARRHRQARRRPERLAREPPRPRRAATACVLARPPRSGLCRDPSAPDGRPPPRRGRCGRPRQDGSTVDLALSGEPSVGRRARRRRRRPLGRPPGAGLRPRAGHGRRWSRPRRDAIDGPLAQRLASFVALALAGAALLLAFAAVLSFRLRRLGGGARASRRRRAVLAGEPPGDAGPATRSATSRAVSPASRLASASTLRTSSRSAAGSPTRCGRRSASCARRSTTSASPACRTPRACTSTAPTRACAG